MIFNFIQTSVVSVFFVITVDFSDQTKLMWKLDRTCVYFRFPVLLSVCQHNNVPSRHYNYSNNSYIITFGM